MKNVFKLMAVLATAMLGWMPVVGQAQTWNANCSGCHGFTIDAFPAPGAMNSNKMKAAANLAYLNGIIAGGMGVLGGLSMADRMAVVADIRNNASNTGAGQTNAQTIIPPGVITSAVLPDPVLDAAGAGIAYNHQITVTNMTSPALGAAGAFGVMDALPNGFTTSVALPNGLTLNGSTGQITGAPSGMGTGAVGQNTMGDVIVNNLPDDAGSASLQMFSVTVRQLPAITTMMIPAGTVGMAYNSGVLVAVGNPVPTFSSANLPAGFAIDMNTGAITAANPANAINQMITVTVTNTINGMMQTSNQNFNLVINNAMVAPIFTNPAPPAMANFITGAMINNIAFTATGTPAPMFSITTNGMPGTPPGLMFANDTLSGTLTTPGMYVVVVTAANGVMPNATQTFTWMVANPVTTFTGPSPTGTGNITAEILNGSGGPTCSFGTRQFVPVSLVPVPAPVQFPHGLFDFTTINCMAGDAVTIRVTYPQTLPAGTQYWKFGPTPANPMTSHWYILPATIAGNTATFTITDGGLGDDDLMANGTIVDQGGPGLTLPVPTLSEWMLMLLGLLVVGSGALYMRRHGQRLFPSSHA